MTDALGDWIESRAAGAVRSFRRAVSATGITRQRAAFGWSVTPAPGSVLASPRFGAWDPEPDYFHHWVRDAAVAIRTLPAILARSGAEDAAWWRAAFHDHVAFSLSISDPARAPLARNPLRRSTSAEAQRFLRPDAELAALRGHALLGEPRFGADGAPDMERWSRPQHDGPALRAGALLFVATAAPSLASPELDALLARDLDFIEQVAGAPSVGPWEEEPARRHAFTLIAQWDALDRGAAWRRGRGELAKALALERAAKTVLLALDGAADEAEGGWRDSVEAPPGGYDASAALAILHAGRQGGVLALGAARTLATVAALERRFADLYPINRGRAVPAIGRWVEDAFFGGNPWFPVTLGFAELHYLIAVEGVEGAGRAYEKAEAWMRLIREFAPAGDALPEQFHRATGAPVSCPELTWSAAAFIGAAAARRAALQAR